VSELYTYKNGKTERRYTRGEARFVLAFRVTVALVTLPFVMAVQAVTFDDDPLEPFGKPSIRLIDGEFYP
jgi:hypothetical protein